MFGEYAGGGGGGGGGLGYRLSVFMFLRCLVLAISLCPNEKSRTRISQNTSRHPFNQDCTACSEGYYCETTGLTTPTGPCLFGHYCKRKVDTRAPIGTITTVSGVRAWCKLKL